MQFSISTNGGENDAETVDAFDGNEENLLEFYSDAFE
jgi:hypothetical protein